MSTMRIIFLLGCMTLLDFVVRANGALAQELQQSVEQTRPLAVEQTRPLALIADEVIAESYFESSFEWRKSSVLLSAEFGQPVELNNFTSRRYGLLVEFPARSVLLGFDLAFVETRSSPSSVLLEETPIRQVGRPSRFEIGGVFELPLAEGAANQLLSVLPAAQMLWALQLRTRKLYYDGMYKNQKGLGLLRSVLSPKLSETQKEDIRSKRLGGMTISEDAVDFMIGLRSVVFHKSGFSVSPSLLVSLPLGARDSSKSLGYWWEMLIGCGYAF